MKRNKFLIGIMILCFIIGSTICVDSFPRQSKHELACGLIIILSGIIIMGQFWDFKQENN